MTGKQFKTAREKLDLSQDQLASVLGFSGKQSISNIERGRVNAGKLTASVLQLLIDLPEKRSKELQELLVALNTSSSSTHGRRS